MANSISRPLPPQVQPTIKITRDDHRDAASSPPRPRTTAGHDTSPAEQNDSNPRIPRYEGAGSATVQIVPAQHGGTHAQAGRMPDRRAPLQAHRAPALGKPALATQRGATETLIRSGRATSPLPSATAAPLEQQVRTQRREVNDLSADLALMLKDIPTLREFAYSRIREQVAADYPGAKVDPEKTLVAVSHTHYRHNRQMEFLVGHQIYEHTSTEAKSLTDVMLNNAAP